MNTPTIQTTPASAPAQIATSGGAPTPTKQRRAFSRAELAFMIGVPLLWALLLLFHPSGDGKEVYLDLQDKVTAALVVHIGTMLFIPLMAVVVYLLLRGLGGTAARVSRIALVPFVVFYSAFDLLQGIGNGILVNAVNGLQGAQLATGADLVQDFAEHVLIRDMGVFVSIGSLGFIAAVIAAGIALHRHAGAPVSVEVLLGLSGFLITAHPPPFGPTGLALFIAAVLLVVRGESAARTAAPRAQAGSA